MSVLLRTKKEALVSTWYAEHIRRNSNDLRCKSLNFQQVDYVNGHSYAAYISLLNNVQS